MLIAREIPSPARARAPSICASKGCLGSVDGKGCFCAIAARRQDDVVRVLHALAVHCSCSGRSVKPGCYP